MANERRSASWDALGPEAKAFRVGHGAWSVVGIATLGYIWACALSGRRDRRLWASIGFLSVEGIALVIGRGDCPFGPFQARLGDPVPFFELVLPPRAAKAAVPVLAGASLLGIFVVIVRMAADHLVAHAQAPGSRPRGEISSRVSGSGGSRYGSAEARSRRW